jgi:hypothetical protein
MWAFCESRPGRFSMDPVTNRVRRILGAIFIVVAFVGILALVALIGHFVGDILGTLYGPSGNTLE